MIGSVRSKLLGKCEISTFALSRSKRPGLAKLYGDWLYSNYDCELSGVCAADVDAASRGKSALVICQRYRARFMDTSASKLFGGLDPRTGSKEFEVYAYHADQVANASSDLGDALEPTFSCRCQVQGANSAETIRADHLHVLVYLDFGMHPRMAQLAALRLAPVQCVAGTRH